MNTKTKPVYAMNAATTALRHIPITQERTREEQRALDAALFERARADRYEVAMRRALLELGPTGQITAKLVLMAALLP